MNTTLLVSVVNITIRRVRIFFFCVDVVGGLGIRGYMVTIFIIFKRDRVFVGIGDFSVFGACGSIFVLLTGVFVDQCQEHSHNGSRCSAQLYVSNFCGFQTSLFSCFFNVIVGFSFRIFRSMYFGLVGTCCCDVAGAFFGVCLPITRGVVRLVGDRCKKGP